MSNHGLEDNKTFDSVNKNATGAGERFADDLHPHVRYAKDGDTGVEQDGTLYSVHDPIPEEFRYTSPVYLLRDDERDTLSDYRTGWETKEECIATDLQNECEADDRVLYPVLIESDEGSIDDQKEWEREFINEYLPVSVHDCQPYFSGSRSLHAHVPLFTTGEGIEYLREVARESHAGLDEAIYSEKRQFRLPGVKHHTTRTPKTAIQWEWEREDIAREVAENGVERPETVADLLRETFGPDVLENPEQFVWEPDTGTEEVKSEPHLWEPGQPKPEGGVTEKWQAYNRHAFSPHAKAEGGTRSMALIEVKNEGYCHDGRTFITAYIWMAVTCTGETWQQDASNGLSPVVLSKADYRKFREMEVKPRDELLIIGGRSHRSRILRVD